MKDLGFIVGFKGEHGKALIEKGETAKIRKAFESIPRGWRQKITRGLELADELSMVQLLKD